MNPAKQRIEWIDAAKGIGILMVMFGHNWLDWRYCYYFYAFHMPLFFILAGVTFSDSRSPLAFICHKAKCLLVPYLFFVVCNLAFRFLLSHTHGNDYDAGADALAFLLQQRHTYLWFLTVLFLSEIAVYCLSKGELLKNLKVGGVILALLISIHAVSVYTGYTDFLWNIDLVPMASVYILLGIFYKRGQQRLHFEKKKTVMIGLFLLSVAAATINFVLFDKVDILGDSYGSLPLFYVAAVSATYAVVLLLKNIKIPRLLLFLGANSLLYYGLHRMVIELLFVVWGKLGLVYDKLSLMSLCVALLNVALTVAILFPVVKFINKRCPWAIGKF